MAARAATLAELRVLVPPTVSVGDAYAQEFLDFAIEMVDLEIFGDRTHRAHAFLTGHFLALVTTEVGGAVGGKAPATSKNIKDISASFAVSTLPSDQELSSTAWGLLFLAQKNRVFAAPVVGGP